MSNKALFLDRDGVINVDSGYVFRREQFEFIDGIFDLCRRARESGYLIVVVTNQSGIGRGYFSEDDFHKLTGWMRNQFEINGCPVAGVYFAPFHPLHGIGRYKSDSDLRKPGPGMILAAKRELDLDLEKSVLVGDSMRDIEAGLAAGVGRNVLLTAPGSETPGSHAGMVVHSLPEVMPLL